MVVTSKAYMKCCYTEGKTCSRELLTFSAKVVLKLY